MTVLDRIRLIDPLSIDSNINSMNKFELSLSALRLPVDFLAVLVAGFLAYSIRVSTTVQEIRPLGAAIRVEDYRILVLAFAGLTILISALSGLYAMKVTRGVVTEFYRIFNAISTAILIIILFYFFAPIDWELFLSRFLFVALWTISIGTVFLGRLLIRALQTFLVQRYRLGLHRAAIILGDSSGDILLEAFQGNPGLGYQVVHTTESFDLKTFQTLATERKIDEVILTNSKIDPQTQMEINEFCDEYKLDFQYIPNLFDTYGKVDVRTLAGVMLFRVKRTTLEGWGSILKRAFDITFAGLFLVIFSPVYILTAIAIKLDSKGPIFYKSIRVGPKNREFEVFKFRSMYTELCTDEKNPETIALEQKLLAEKGIKQGPVNKIKDDPRVTRVGKFIRKTSIDELPQFWNVLVGNMSVVGPRPHQPREVAKYEKHHKKVLTIKPGITGMAQVNGRSDLTFDEEVLYDTFYIENWSLMLDLIIILKTPWAVIAPRKAD